MLCAACLALATDVEAVVVVDGISLCREHAVAVVTSGRARAQTARIEARRAEGDS